MCPDIHIGSRVDSGVILTLERIFNHVCGDREPGIFAEKTGQFQLRLWRPETGILLDICGCFCGHKLCVVDEKSRHLQSCLGQQYFFDETLGLLQELGHLDPVKIFEEKSGHGEKQTNILSQNMIFTLTKWFLCLNLTGQHCLNIKKKHLTE